MVNTTTLALALCAGTLAGCGSIKVGIEHDKATPTRTGVAKATPAATATATAQATATPAAATAADHPCNGRPGKEIPAIDADAVHVDAITVPDQRLAGHDVPGFTIPAVDIPAVHVPAQCATIAEAPAGCLGAVDIPAGYIPPVRIPEVTIPGVDVPGAHLSPAHNDAAEISASSVVGAHTGRVCAQKVPPGGFRPTIAQSTTTRPTMARPTATRPTLVRPSVCAGNNQCLPAVTVPGVIVPGVIVPGVIVPGRIIAGRKLPEITSKCVNVFQGAGQTAYNVCSDVLFDFDKSNIRPSADSALRQIARSLAKRFPGRHLQVDGHTDSVGSPAYNAGLSQRRADAVKRWLVAHGHIPASRISTKGYGETRPVDTNASSAGRQKNRRVVVGVS